MKQYSYKQRVIGLSIVFTLMLFLSWSLAVEKTFDLYFDNSSLEKQLTSASLAPQKIATYNQTLDQLDQHLFLNVDQENRQDDLLECIGRICKDNKLTLLAFPELIVQQVDGYHIETNVIEVEGKYTKLVEMIYKIEQVQKLGRISSVEYELLKDRRTKKEKLIAKIFLQVIKSKI
ncbi:MAG: hypothetical protein JKY33_08360 [Bacteroidia bacterium]|nr:hypothetical protein [Bacteroidia bacterium]